MTKVAILYARVSTRGQAEGGFSLRQQLEALREWCAREGYEILEEVEDAGHSGASLERPGLDRVRDLVAAGGVSVVLAQDRDRFAREPAYVYLLRREFEQHGTKMRALNDQGDECPEGELTDGILDQLAKFERAKIAERSRRGKLHKAAEGKVVGGHLAAYGFCFNTARDGYEVDEDTMPVVRRIFRMVGVERQPINAVRRALETEGISSPSSRARPEGGRTWSRVTIRVIVQDDKYRPHTHAEVAQMVAPAVAARLDPRQRYGICSYNGVPIPVPDSGIPREWVDAAREAIRENLRPSSAGHRLWQLGGLLFCEHCGRRTAPNALMKRPSAPSFYYRCPTRQHGAPRRVHTRHTTAPRAWRRRSGRGFSLSCAIRIVCCASTSST
jgi:site-specific DNA recombinase